jgi:hypothetical protein
MAINDSTFRDFVMNGRRPAAPPRPNSDLAMWLGMARPIAAPEPAFEELAQEGEQIQSEEPAAKLDDVSAVSMAPVSKQSASTPHEAAMLDAYHGALGFHDEALQALEAAQASGDQNTTEAASRRVQHAQAQLDNLDKAFTAISARKEPMKHPGAGRPEVAIGVDRTGLEDSLNQPPAEEEDAFKKWVRDNGLSGGIGGAGQGGRSRDYMEEMQQILLGRAGLHYSPSFAGEQLAAAGERNEANDALRAQEAQNNAARTQAYLAAQDRNASTSQQRLAGEEKKQESAEERFLRTQSETERHNKAVEEAAKAERARRAAAGIAGRGAKEAKDAAKKEAQGWKDVTELRKEFNAQPIVKSFSSQRQEFEKMKSAAANPSAAGDMTLIFSLMKVMDPASSVKEGEFDLAAQAGGLTDRMRNSILMAKNGQRLTPEQRADFLRQATNVFSAAQAQYDEQTDRYRDLAAKIGGDPDDVVKVGGAPASKPKSGLVRVREKATGATKSMKAEDAKEFLASPDFEEVR